MRMLAPRELFRAQGFPDSYVIDRGADGEAFTQTTQIRLCGNSVSPPVAAAIVAADSRRAVWPDLACRTRGYTGTPHPTKGAPDSRILRKMVSNRFAKYAEPRRTGMA